MPIVITYASHRSKRTRPERHIFELIREDLRRACLGNQGGSTSLGSHLRELFNPGTHAILAHRFGVWVRTVRIPLVRHGLLLVHFVIEYIFAWRVGVLIPVLAEIGPGMVIHTWGGGVVLPACRIGKHMTIVGGGVQFDYATKSIGDELWIGPGAKCVGKITIGSRVKIAPNAVVQVDLPDDSLAFGNPARVVSARKWAFGKKPSISPQPAQ